MGSLTTLLAVAVPQEGHEVPLFVTLLFGAVLVGLILCLALEEKIHARKSVIAGSFAILCLILGTALHLLPFEPILLAGQELHIPVYILGVDWNVIAVIFGANLGGNLTPIGSASTLVAVTIIHKNKLALSFAGFVKMALPYAVIQIVLSVAYVLLFVR